ncbi:adenylosuccinate lyase [Candidatus Uhrbacteria bacterium]|nr:adenylosuccinate lyase [Candidatus Uhrbacteria bacterium]
MKLPLSPLTAISPLDGRYAHRTEPLRAYLSEYALMKYRCLVEIEYLIAFSFQKEVRECKPISRDLQKKLRDIVKDFSLADAKKIKQLEKKTNHDVKAIEYFLQKKITDLDAKHLLPFLHFALTSEDVNNIAYTLMWRDAIRNAYVPLLRQLHKKLYTLSHQWSDIPLLSLTHGQSASPTTLGKEISVFAYRLSRQLEALCDHEYSGKFNGAVGTWAAHVIAYPNVDWMKFSANFLKSFGLLPTLHTTQIENGDALAANYLRISQINTILLDLVRDIWLYCMRGHLRLRRLSKEVGSSTMPHKINPIQFENAEGNLGAANAQLYHLASALPVSRLQRDLSGSTLIRTQGCALAHSFTACHTIISGLERITPNRQSLSHELDVHWEVLAEAIQTLLRKAGKQDAYEIVKNKTRGMAFSQEDYHVLIDDLPLPSKDKLLLKKLSPQRYIGYAAKLASLIPMP